MGTLSLRSGSLLAHSQARDHGVPVVFPVMVQLHCQGSQAKLGCTGWEAFKGRQCLISRRIRTSGLGTHASIGFTADPRVKIERSATALLKDAAMLLVYQDVLKSPPAQAFLRVLLGLRRADDGLKLLESYGEFFKLMAMSRSPSWEDFLLDGILSGENNPFAEAAANAGNPKSLWSGGVPPALRAAAASDLDSLHRLNVSESTLCGWVAEVVSDTRPEWRTAAAANLSSRSVVKPPPSVAESTWGPGFALNDEDNSAREEIKDREVLADSVESHNLNGSSTASHSDFVSRDRERWRKKVGGLWKWSEAVPLLEEYYAEHGVSRVVSTQALHWKGGKLTRDLRHLGRHQACELGVQTDQRNALIQNLRKHAKGLSVHHLLLCGPSGSGKSWLLSYVLHKVAHEEGLRVVSFPTTEMKSLGQLLEELARHWKTRFALVIDDPFTRAGEENVWLLKTALDGGSQEWPENVLLCVTCLKTIRELDLSFRLDSVDLKLLFGKVLHLKNLVRAEYVTTAVELFKYQTKSLLSTSKSIQEVRSEADAYYTELSVEEDFLASLRHVAHFVKSII